MRNERVFWRRVQNKGRDRKRDNFLDFSRVRRNVVVHSPYREHKKELMIIEDE